MEILLTNYEVHLERRRSLIQLNNMLKNNGAAVTASTWCM